MEVYNKNRDKNNSIHDEIREQNAKLKDAPLKDKLVYYKDYYLKITIVILIVIATAVSIVHTILTAPSDTAFAAFFYNNTGDSSNTELLDSFVEYMEIDTREHNVYINTDMNYYPDSIDTSIYLNIEKTMASMSVGEVDIIVGDIDTIDYFMLNDCFHDLTTILPDDLITEFEDRFYYAESNETGEQIPVGIYVTDSPKLNQYSYYINREPILGFIANSDSLDNAIAFLRYIYIEE